MISYIEKQSLFTFTWWLFVIKWTHPCESAGDLRKFPTQRAGNSKCLTWKCGSLEILMWKGGLRKFRLECRAKKGVYFICKFTLYNSVSNMFIFWSKGFLYLKKGGGIWKFLPKKRGMWKYSRTLTTFARRSLK